MTEWNVRRWRRYGHDRLYASTPGGTDLGYLDLTTGRYRSDDMSNLPLLRRAIEDHFAAQRPPHQGSGTTPAPAPGPSAAPGPAPTRSPELARTDTPDAVAHGRVSPHPPPAPSPWQSPSPGPTGPRWHDLADVRAGASARERALAERAAQGTIRHLFARLVDARTDVRAWRIGADGEGAVAEQLAGLGVHWRVLHAVRVGDRGADIDHVVVGPGGVFTVNAKNHPKASVWVGGDVFLVNGQRHDYVRKSRFEAERASRMLAEHVGFPVPVTGVIAVVGARRGFTVKAQPADGAVVVVPRRGIRRFLQSRPSRLGLREIDAIHEVARRSSTWQR